MNASAKRILLVEPDVEAREALETMLRRLRYEVVGVADAEGALALLRATHIDLVVLHLPGPAARSFRRIQNALAHIPVLAVAAEADVEAEAHIRAPIDATVLAKKVRELVEPDAPAPDRVGARWRAEDGAQYDLDDPMAFLTQALGKMGARLPDLVDKLRALDPGSPDMNALMEQALRGGARIASYVPYLNAFGTGAAGQRAPMDIRTTLDHVIGFAWPEIRQRAILRKSFREVPLVVANDEQMGQVFSSLIINAAQAIPYGNPDGNHIDVSAFTDENGWATAEVRDTGSGIEAELLTKVFEPFFSTKRGVGMGLGLFIVRNLVSMAGGKIAVQSEVGRGTTFRISLPPAA